MASQGADDALQTLRTGKSNLKVELGEKRLNIQPVRWWDYFGISHAAEKSFLKRGDFEMRLARLEYHARQNGIDTTDGMVQAGLRIQANEESDRAILQERNIIAQWVNTGYRLLENADPATKEVDKDRAVISWAIKTFVTKGIVKTPLNYIKQSFANTPISLVRGAAGLIRANMRPVEALTPKEANTIARCFKAGLVGTGMFVWGMIDATKDPKDRMFGGYYQPGDKRDKDDVEFGKIRVDGHSLWHIATHGPLTEPAQMGSTMVRVMMSKVNKKSDEDRGVIAGATASILALASTAPIANPITDVSKDVEQGHGDQVLWDEIANLVPMLVQNIAEDVDPAKSRKAVGPVDTIKSKIPLLREDLPERNIKSKYRSAIPQ